VNLWNQINPFQTPDRDDMEQQRYRKVMDSISWTFLNKRREEQFSTAKEAMGYVEQEPLKYEDYFDRQDEEDDNPPSSEPKTSEPVLSTKDSIVDFGKPKSPRNRFRNDHFKVIKNDEYESIKGITLDFFFFMKKDAPRIEYEGGAISFWEVHDAVKIYDASHVVTKLRKMKGKYIPTILGFVRSDVWGTPNYPIQVYRSLANKRDVKQTELLFIFLNSVSICKIKHRGVNFCVDADIMSKTHLSVHSTNSRFINRVCEFFGIALKQ
jgi:hypothetical protein